MLQDITDLETVDIATLTVPTQAELAHVEQVYLEQKCPCNSFVVPTWQQLMDTYKICPGLLTSEFEELWDLMRIAVEDKRTSETELHYIESLRHCLQGHKKYQLHYRIITLTNLLYAMTVIILGLQYSEVAKVTETTTEQQGQQGQQGQSLCYLSVLKFIHVLLKQFTCVFSSLKDHKPSLILLLCPLQDIISLFNFISWHCCVLECKEIIDDFVSMMHIDFTKHSGLLMTGLESLELNWKQLLKFLEDSQQVCSVDEVVVSSLEFILLPSPIINSLITTNGIQSQVQVVERKIIRITFMGYSAQFHVPESFLSETSSQFARSVLTRKSQDFAFLTSKEFLIRIASPFLSWVQSKLFMPSKEQNFNLYQSLSIADCRYKLSAMALSKGIICNIPGVRALAYTVATFTSSVLFSSSIENKKNEDNKSKSNKKEEEKNEINKSIEVIEVIKKIEKKTQTSPSEEKSKKEKEKEKQEQQEKQEKEEKEEKEKRSEEKIAKKTKSKKTPKNLNKTEEKRKRKQKQEQEQEQEQEAQEEKNQLEKFQENEENEEENSKIKNKEHKEENKSDKDDKDEDEDEDKSESTASKSKKRKKTKSKKEKKKKRSKKTQKSHSKRTESRSKSTSTFRSKSKSKSKSESRSKSKSKSKSKSRSNASSSIGRLRRSFSRVPSPRTSRTSSTSSTGSKGNKNNNIADGLKQKAKFVNSSSTTKRRSSQELIIKPKPPKVQVNFKNNTNKFYHHNSSNSTYYNNKYQGAYPNGTYVHNIQSHVNFYKKYHQHQHQHQHQQPKHQPKEYRHALNSSHEMEPNRFKKPLWKTQQKFKYENDGSGQQFKAEVNMRHRTSKLDFEEDENKNLPYPLQKKKPQKRARSDSWVGF